MAKSVFATASAVTAGTYITSVGANKSIAIRVSGLASGESVEIHKPAGASWDQCFEKGEAIAITYPDNVLPVNGPFRFTYVKGSTAGVVTVEESEAENV
jgi:hypothetical protein